MIGDYLLCNTPLTSHERIKQLVLPGLDGSSQSEISLRNALICGPQSWLP